MNEQDKVASKSKAALRMSAWWDVCTTLWNGTEAMREAGVAYLPMWPNEDPESYKTRKSISTLFPAFKRTVVTLAARPFSQAITLGEGIPARIKALLPDIDLRGTNLDTFAADLMQEVLGKGLVGILVEYKLRPEGVVTVAQETAAKLRPYFVKVKVESILGWKSALVDGKLTLTQLRIMESVEVDDGDFDTKEIDQVRVLEIGKWTTYRKDAAGHWVQEAAGLTTLSSIPFVPIYGERVAFMVGKPPLLELAHLNVKHWQSQSDQDTLMHVARVAILVAKGVSKTFKLIIGANSSVKIDENASLEYVEHTGAAIGAGKTSLDDLKEDMRQAGAELLVMKTSGPATATEVASDNAVGMCALQEMTAGVEDALDQALQLLAEWLGESDGGTVNLFKDFGAATLAEASAQVLLSMASAGKLSNETLVNEYKRRGILSADVTWEDEQDNLTIESPPPPTGNIDPLTGLPYDKPVPPQPKGKQ